MTALGAVVAVGLAALAAALRAAGGSMIHTPRADALHDAAEGRPGAAVIAELLEDRSRVQPAITMVHSGLLVGSAVLGSWVLAGRAEGLRLLAAVALLGLVLVTVADVIPRQVGRRHPGRLAYRLAGLLRAAASLGGRAADLVEEEPAPEEPAADDQEEIQDREERELISQVLEFSDAVVREVMVPRPDMVTIPVTASTDEALDLVIERGFSRIPVLGEGPDNVLGIVYAKDLLRIMNGDESAKAVADIMREPYFVPETKRVAGLLREMQANMVHMAVVVDEFGGVAGLVTIEDLLEELVGEIVDEYDREEPMVIPQRGGEYLVDGRMPVDELGDLLSVEFPEGDWDTVGGLVLGLAGRVPREGERFELEHTLLVPERVQGRRVARIRVAPLSR